MHTITSIVELRGYLDRGRSDEMRTALVPTMGNLHEGHLTLVRAARGRAQRVVVSIFVNPMQFGSGEDLASYPRTLAQDRDAVEAEGAQVLFLPDPGEVYPRGLESTTRVEVPEVSHILCGEFRPGHFVGVTTVVNILFNIVRPQVAVFGLKDYQQFLVIQRMVNELHMPVELVGVPTVREPDGLAMSSRNRYLTPGERARAPALYRMLESMAERIRSGERDFAGLEREGLQVLEAAGFVPEYFTVRSARTLDPAVTDDGNLVLLTAARLGSARLIDNLLLDPPAG